MEQAQHDTQALFLKCAGELDRVDNTYKVSTWETTLTKRRVENGCWDGYHARSALVVVYNCAPKVVLAYLDKDKQKVWNVRRQSSQCEISCEFAHLVFCAWLTYVAGCGGSEAYRLGRQGVQQPNANVSRCQCV